MAPERPTSDQETSSTQEALQGGKLLVQLRMRCGYSQAGLAQEANLNQSCIHYWEKRGQLTSLPYKTTIALAEALGVGINFDLDQYEQKVFVLPQALQIYDALYPEELRIMIGDLRKNFNIEPEDITYITYSPSFTRIGDKIRNLRLNHPDHPSQTVIASRSGNSQSFISDLEKEGNRKEHSVNNPSMARLRTIAKALGTDIYDLLEIKEIQYPPEVAYLDRFLRSREVPPTVKRKLIELVKKMEAVSKKSSSLQPRS